MTCESGLWFTGQALASGAALFAGRYVADRSARCWKPTAAVAALVTLLWPVLRLQPLAALALVPAAVLAFVEVTGIIVPAALLFGIALRHVRPPDRRALSLLLCVCGLYFARSGAWMLRPALPDWPMSRYVDGVCRQSTNYTCVAASLVTLLSMHGIEATESEMARLSYTEAGNGATDLRAVLALQRKLRDQPFVVRYERLDYARLRQVNLPCLVSLEWGYFTSHMMPVLEVGDDVVIVGDPLAGRREMPRAEFERLWHHRGIYLQPRPTL